MNPREGRWRAAPLPPAESARLAVLAEYGVVDTPPEQFFDDIAELAAALCSVPMALVAFADRRRVWFKARVGLERREIPREITFCAHAILHPEDLLVVADARQDAVFCKNPLVAGDLQLRFYAGAPLVSPGGHAIGTVCVMDTKPHTLSAQKRQGLKVLARAVMGQLELWRAHQQLAQQGVAQREYTSRLEQYREALETANTRLQIESLTDPLTGLGNRRACEQRLHAELARVRRHAQPLCLLLCDVDRFKDFNDNFGHAAGDSVLRKVGRVFAATLRASDHCARIGGDEIAAILPQTPIAEAHAVAERLRIAVLGEQGLPRAVQISIGIAAYGPGTDSPATLLNAADNALYRAKLSGRNRVSE